MSLKVMFNSSFYYTEDNFTEKQSHYGFFLPASDFSFFSKIKDGAIKAAESMDCAITFYQIDNNPLSLEMVPASGLDGICLYPYNLNDKMIESVINISDSGIPVVQIENEIFSNDSTLFIGTNNFDSGKAIGELAKISSNSFISIAVIYSEKNPGLYADSSLVEIGIRSVLGNTLAGFYSDLTNLNPLDAERLIYDLLKKQPNIDIIVLTDPNDTMVAVQAIIDLNMVGMIKIIGFGEDEQIKNYIKKGVIFGTIVRNPYSIGFSAVMALEDVKYNGNTSSYVDTGINIITSKSLMGNSND